MKTSATLNILHFLEKLDPFDKLPTEIVEQLAELVVVRYLAKGETIDEETLSQSAHLYFIRSGAIEQKDSTGGLLARLGENDQFGFTFFQDSSLQSQRYQVYALDSTLLYSIPYETVRKVMSSASTTTDCFDPQAPKRLNSAVNHSQHKENKSLFFRTVKDIASENITSVDYLTPIQDVAERMCSRPKSSCAVVEKSGELVGVITDRDMTMKVVAKGLPLTTPVHQIMTSPVTVIDEDERIIEAISLMLEHNIRSLPVISKGQVCGLLTTTHLVHNHRTQSLFLIEKIRYADSIEALAKLRDEKESIFQALVENGTSSNLQGKIMSMIMDAFTRRIIELTEKVLGPAPCKYAWMVAGSHARNEVHLLSDQDNAIVVEDDKFQEHQLYFAHLAMRVCNALAACGYPLCDGKYMAASPRWCQPLQRWKHYYNKWVSSPEYNQLLNISVFLETRAIYGSYELVEELQDHLNDCIQHNSSFLPCLTRDAINISPPLSIFNNLVVEKGGEHSNTLNIKKYALNLIVDLARIFSLSVGCKLAGTEERFRYAMTHKAISEDACESIIEALRFISQVRFRHQLHAIQNGHIPDNHIAPDQFSSFERKHLKEAFKIIGNLQDVAKLRFVKGNQ
ncbi:DUF294 nucleotidyltransferase-like domain-containing protein [Vibrio harveyi]|uniref:DUF294 nucleotidyltransferase-like domain-containing protein n=1 Tax=Vibrio harveyi TaxID=669 RepID=UPI0031BB9EB9